MLKLGYKLMSEEHGPADLVRNAQRAEQAGSISRHFIILVQVGPQQNEFIEFYQRHLAPALRNRQAARNSMECGNEAFRNR